jgi:hypothetical protein
MAGNDDSAISLFLCSVEILQQTSPPAYDIGRDCFVAKALLAMTDVDAVGVTQSAIGNSE